jgi:hypothetical protein
MEKKNTTVFYNGLIWGLILGFAGVIYSVILYMLDQSTNQALGYAGLIITIVLLILGMRSFRDSVRDGIMPFGTAFSFGILAIVVSGIIGTIYAYLLFNVIDPDLITRIQEIQVEKMLDRGIPEEALDEVLPRMERFMQPGLLALMGLLSSLFMGAIISLILAAIFKRDEIPFDPIVEE